MLMYYICRDNDSFKMVKADIKGISHTGTLRETYVMKPMLVYADSQEATTKHSARLDSSFIK